MSLNISAKRKAGGRATKGGARAREDVISELIGEMTSWAPRDRMSAFRSWLKGSLSLIHLNVLSVLEAEGPLPMSKLADVLDVSVASATGIVSRMEERHLVERQHDRDDRRVVLVVPTDAGTAVFRTMAEQRRERLTALLGRLTDDELAAFLVGLRAVRAAREDLHAELEARGEDPHGPAPSPATGAPKGGPG